MGSPQTLTQRLVPALAVTLVSTLVLGAVVVTADVADGTEPVLPQWFTIAAPMQGDAWRYNVTLGGDWTFGGQDEVEVGEELPFGKFQWAGAGTVRGGDGLMHDANFLYAEHLAYNPLYLQVADEDACEEPEQSGCVQGFAISSGPEETRENVTLVPDESPYWSDTNSSGWVLAGGRSILSRGDMHHEVYNETNYGPLSGGLPSTGVGAYHTKSIFAEGFIEYPSGEVPCLAFNPLQGNNVSLTSAIALFDECALGDEFLAIPDGLTFYAAAVETVAGVEAVRFDARQNGTYHAWFAPAVPYPVRLSFSLAGERPAILEEGTRDLPGDRSATLDLVGFQAGAAQLDAADDPADRAPAPAFENAPQQVAVGIPAGPSEEGITHPFPLSMALQKAREEATFQDLNIYLEGYPDAYVQHAEYREGHYSYSAPTSQMAPARVWAIVLADGLNEPFAFEAAQQTFDTYVPTEARDEAAQQPQYFFQRGYGDYYGGYYGDYYAAGMPSGEAPRKAQIPQEMPTALSLMDRWFAFDGFDLPANSWGFNIACAENVEPCRTEVQLLVGHRRETNQGGFAGPQFISPVFPIPGDPYGNEEYAVVDRLMAFDLAGMADFQFVYDERYYRSAADGPLGGDHVPLPSLDPPSDPGYDVQSTEVSGVPSSAMSWVPAPKEAASIGFMGLVIGALYWIWPKLGVVGLFSRLHRGELLDHPARAKLVQIVEAQPGIHFHDLALKAELANGTAVHHLRKLSDSGHLSVRRSGRYTCYFPGGRVDPHAAAAAPLLKSDGAKLILEAVRNKPGMSNLELAQATGLQPSTVNYHVQRLAQAGLLAALRDGRSVRLHPGIRTGGDPPAAAA